ncbi:hypothetical protein AgCh_003663 [Apium graveolens]
MVFFEFSTDRKDLSIMSPISLASQYYRPSKRKDVLVIDGELDTEGAEQHQEDVTSAFVEAFLMCTHDEVLDFGKAGR